MLALVLSLSCIMFPAYGQEGETTGEVVSEGGAKAGGDEMLGEGEGPTAEEIATEVATDKALEAQMAATQAAREAETALNADDQELAVAKFKSAVELVPDNEAYINRLKDTQKAYIYSLLKKEQYAEVISQADDFLARFTDVDDAGVVGVTKFRKTATELLAAGPVDKPVTSDFVQVPGLEERTDKELIGAAIQAYRKQDYDTAKELLLDARDVNRYNVEINRWLDAVNFKLLLHERSIRITTRRDMLNDVNRAWNARPARAVLQAGPIELPEEQEMTEARIDIMKKLETIIPKVDFKEADIREVIEFLAREADVNIVLDPSIFPTLGTMTGTGSGDEGFPPNEGPDFPPDDGIGEGEDITFPDDAGGGEFAPQGSMMGPGGTMPGPGFGPDSGLGPPSGGFGPDLGMAPGVGAQPALSSKITIKLTKVPLKYVLRYVLRYKNLKYVVEDYAILIIRIDYVPPEELDTEIFRLSTSGIGTSATGASTGSGFGMGDTGGAFGGDSFGGGGGGEETTMGQPENIEDFLRRSGVTWPEGSNIIYHSPTATLIVKNTPTNMVLIRELIKIWDRKPMQVEVEARFVELQYNRNFQNSFRVNMTDALRWTRNDNRNLGTMPLGSQERIELLSTPGNMLRVDQPLTSALLDVKGILTRPEFQLTWYALDQNEYTDLLSAPRVTTVSGQQALIQIVKEIRYPTEYETESLDEVTLVSDQFQAFYVTASSFETREVGIRLSVTPTVSSDDLITLVLLPEVSELVEWINYGTDLIPENQPIFESRNITTTVYLNDGETIVLGGVIKDNVKNVKDRVPFLGSIPVLGRLFRSDYEVVDKSNLVIFVTADLITSRGTPVKEEREATRQREVFLAKYAKEVEAANEDEPTIPSGD